MKTSSIYSCSVRYPIRARMRSRRFTLSTRGTALREPVQHSAETFKGGRLPQNKACFFSAVRLDQSHRPSHHPRLLQLYRPAVILFLQYYAAVPRHKEDLLRRAQLPRDPVDVQRFLHAFPFLSVRKGGSA